MITIRPHFFHETNIIELKCYKLVTLCLILTSAEVSTLRNLASSGNSLLRLEGGC